MKDVFVLIAAQSPLAELYRPHGLGKVTGNHLLLKVEVADMAGPLYASLTVKWPGTATAQNILIHHHHILAVLSGSTEPAGIGFVTS